MIGLTSFGFTHAIFGLCCCHHTKLQMEPPPTAAPKPTPRRKMQLEFIQDKAKRTSAFGKRKGGIMKKAYELHTLTGCDVMLLLERNGEVFTYASDRLVPMIAEQGPGRPLVLKCLEAP
jgi:hypothetical protein